MSHTALKHTITQTILALQKRGTGKFKLLDSDGLCAVGESIENGDYYINKISPTNTKDLFPMGPGGVLPDHMYKPTPMSYKGSKGETSVVDKVLLTQNDENEEIIKVSKLEKLAATIARSSKCCAMGLSQASSQTVFSTCQIIIV